MPLCDRTAQASDVSGLIYSPPASPALRSAGQPQGWNRRGAGGGLREGFHRGHMGHCNGRQMVGLRVDV